MKINKISITNYRSIKKVQIIENIWDSLILTWINNSWKSVFLNAIAVFLWEKTITENDFHKLTDEIKIIVYFDWIEDDFLKGFCVFKETSSRTTTLKRSKPFLTYSKNEIKNKDDLESEEQIIFLENQWLEKFKSENTIVDWNITIELILSKNDLKKRDYVWKNKIEQILPKPIFIDDERKFENEEYWWNWSITKKFFEWLDLNDFDDPPYDIETVKEKKWEDLSIYELEKLLKLKWWDITEKMQNAISDNFWNFYNSSYKVKIEPNASIAHKNFSLETKIIDPIIWETSLSNVWAWLRALYLLSLLKAYNDFNMNINLIFLIEEPELYLHPWLQKEMANILNNISKNQQVFFTTHSPILLKNFDLLSIKEIKKEHSNSIICNANFNNIISNLWFSLFDIIKYKYLIFVEWRDDYFVLQKIINKFYSDKKDEIEIITSNWCWNLSFYASLKFLWLTNNWDIKYFILRDRDNKTDEVLKYEFNKSLEDKDLKPSFITVLWEKFKILDRYSIENFFLIEEKISLIKNDFVLNDFIDSFDIFETNSKESLKKWNETQFSEEISLLKNNFISKSKEIRWHNIFNWLIYYINWNDKRYVYDKNKRNEFIDKYINNSDIEDFWILKEYLDELLN